VFECFGAFRRFFSKLFDREHETLLCDTNGGLPRNGAVTPAYWVLVTVYGDDQDELRYLNDFVGKNRHIFSEKPAPTPCGGP
jgi:hypothetical protein